MITDAICLALERFLGSLPVLVIAIVIAQTLSLYVSKEKIGRLLKEARRNIIAASLLGLVTPGHWPPTCLS